MEDFKDFEMNTPTRSIDSIDIGDFDGFEITPQKSPRKSTQTLIYNEELSIFQVKIKDVLYPVLRNDEEFDKKKNGLFIIRGKEWGKGIKMFKLLATNVQMKCTVLTRNAYSGHLPGDEVTGILIDVEDEDIFNPSDETQAIIKMFKIIY